MTTVVIDSQRSVTVNDQGTITRITVAQAGVQGPQGDPTTVNGKTGATITLTASDVGAIATSARGAVNGVAELDSSGLVPLGELPVADLAGDFMDLSTDQTAATGIKTFSVSPVVPTPTTGGQAANKTYADTMLPKAGGTMTGPIVLAANPTTSLQAAPKQYADLMLPLTGGTMSGAIAMGTSKITGVGNGSSAQDVAAFGQLPSSTNLLPIASGGTGSTTKNFVDLTTAQTVAGVKAFSSSPTGPTPSGSTDLVNKAYADSIAAGLQPKPSASLATAAALPTNVYSNGSSGVGATLTGVSVGVLTVDGTAVTLGMTILVKNEATSANNGLYTCTTAGAVATLYVLTRSVDMNTSTEFPGAYSYVESGTVNVGSQWAVSGLGPFTVGTTAVPYVQVGGPGSTSAGTGLTLTGSVMSLTNPVTVALGGTGSATQNFVDLTTAQAAIAGAKTFTGLLTGSARIRATSTGASTGTGGFMGQTAGGPPASGTFVVGDFIIDGVNGATWICITAGTPGTWMPAGAVPLGTKILAANAANISINVPAYVNHIMGFFSGRQDNGSGGAYCKMQFNLDTGTHYDWQLVQGTISTASSSNAGAAVAFMEFGVIPGSGDTANYFGTANFTISNVQSAVFKPMRSSFGGITSPSVGYAGEFAGLWLSTAAITSVQVLPNSGNLGPGSSLTLIGYP